MFPELIHAECDRIRNPFTPLAEQMHAANGAEAGVGFLAEQFASTIANHGVQRLRRLVIAESARFPGLGLLYWERGLLPMLEAVGHCLEVLQLRGMLDVPDPLLAANHFAGLLLWIPSNQAMFAAAARPVTDADLAAVIDAGVAAFLRAYSPPAAPAPAPAGWPGGGLGLPYPTRTTSCRVARVMDT